MFAFLIMGFNYFKYERGSNQLSAVSIVLYKGYCCTILSALRQAVLYINNKEKYVPSYPFRNLFSIGTY